MDTLGIGTRPSRLEEIPEVEDAEEEDAIHVCFLFFQTIVPFN